MTKTVVGVFDTRDEAEQVRNQIVNLGISSGDVHIQGQDAGSDWSSSSSSSSASGSEGGGIRGFFKRMFGGDDYDTHAGHYSEAVRRGSYVVCATAQDDATAERVATVMDQAGAVNIDHRSARWSEQGWTDYRDDAPALSSAELAQERELNLASRSRVPVIDEQLQVGKRAVERGGVRLFTRVIEQPVEENVTLREERARVTRHPVDRAATEADIRAAEGGVIEVRETVEEPVVQKVARVVEEIEVGKEVEEHTETIRDTVRHTDVEIDEGPGPRGKRVSRDDRPGSTR